MKVFKICMKVVLMIMLVVSILIGEVNVANAETFAVKPKSEDDKFVVSYDSTKYVIFWVSRKKITAKSQYGSMWSDLDEGDELGTATIRVYYLEPKGTTGGSYYAMAGCQVSMDPADVAGDVTGMSQLADFRICTINEDSRVCSPTVNVLNIQASKTSNSSNGFTAGTGLTYNTDKKAWEVSGDFNFTKSWGSCSSYTYNMSNVNLTQKNKNGQYASWRYDYKSKDEDVVWNAYLMSSSKVAGQVVYRLDQKPSISNRSKLVPSKVYYDIRFGAGDASTGEVANRLGWSSNRDMSISTGTMTLSY